MVLEKRSDLRQVFATNLVMFRRAKGLSQERLAKEANVNKTYVGKLEKGRLWVGLEVIDKLSRALDIRPGEMLQEQASEQLPKDE